MAFKYQSSPLSLQGLALARTTVMITSARSDERFTQCRSIKRDVYC